MAINNKKLVVLILVAACFFFCINGFTLSSLKTCGFDSFYQFGDSISDTGNIVRLFPGTPSGSLPYGQNFINHIPTGRCSNGFLIIDYMAMGAGLSLLQPYKNVDGDFRHGVNFAVAGSTALSSPMRNSLDFQLDWMSLYLNSTCHDQNDCAKKLENALVWVGEIGGNDYNNGIFQRKSQDELKILVTDVVDAILNGVREVVNFGAKKVVVPGNFPVGCIPIYKYTFATNDTKAYDEYKCLKQFNEFAKYQNAELKRGIRKMVEEEKPNATIVYADYYSAYQFLLKFSKLREIDTDNACCVSCGTPNSQVCENPDKYISWDGMHLTQEAYKVMAIWLVKHLVRDLNCQ